MKSHPKNELLTRWSSKRAGAWSTLTLAVSMAFSLLITLVGAHILTISEYGRYATAIAAGAFIQVVCLFSLQSAVLRFAPELMARDEPSTLKKFLILVLFIETIIWAACVAFAYSLTSFGVASSEAVSPVLLVAPYALLYSYYTTAAALLTAIHDIKVQFFGSAFSGIASVIVSYLWVPKSGQGAGGVILVQTMSVALVTAMYLFRIAGKLRGSSAGPAVSLDVKRILRFAAPYAASSIVGAIYQRQSEVLILGLTGHNADAAIYSVAYSLPQRMTDVLPLGVAPVISVVTAEAFLEGRAALARVVRLYADLLYIAAALVGGFGFAYAPEITALFYGQVGARAEIYVRLLPLIFAFALTPSPYLFALRAEEKTHVLLKATIPVAALTLAVDLIFIPRWGLNGAMTATAVSYIAATFYSIIFYRKALPYLRLSTAAARKAWLAALVFAGPWLLTLIFPLSHFMVLATAPPAILLWCWLIIRLGAIPRHWLKILPAWIEVLTPNSTQTQLIKG